MLLGLSAKALKKALALSKFWAIRNPGQAYANSTKKAIHIRERETQIPWWTLSTSYTLLFSKFTDKGNIYSTNETTSGKEKENDRTYHTSLKPDNG